jgi:hypothetical protein
LGELIPSPVKHDWPVNASVLQDVLLPSRQRAIRFLMILNRRSGGIENCRSIHGFSRSVEFRKTAFEWYEYWDGPKMPRLLIRRSCREDSYAYSLSNYAPRAWISPGEQRSPVISAMDRRWRLIGESGVTARIDVSVPTGITGRFDGVILINKSCVTHCVVRIRLIASN